jgi:hypothetical protein
VSVLASGWSRRVESVIGVVVLVTSTAAPIRGQTIQGRVSDAQTDAPVASALVRLIDPSGVPRAVAVADSIGRYELIAPAPGRYRLRAEQLGYETREAVPFQLTATELLSRDLQLEPSPLPIVGVEVTADQVDRRLRQFLGMSTAQLRIRPIRAATIEEHASRGDGLAELMARRNIPNLQSVRSRTGPCFQFRGRDCLPIYLDGARLSRSSTPMLPLEMLNAIVVLLPSETVAYSNGAILLFSTGFMR